MVTLWGRVARVVVVVGLLGMSLGCGGGGSSSSGSSADAPVISNLFIRPFDPERVNRDIRYGIQVTVFDRQPDIFNGICEVALQGFPGSPLSIPIDRVGPGIDINATTNPVVCLFVVRSSVPVQVNGSITIIDRAGHRSNSLGFVIGIAQRPSGGGEAPAGSVAVEADHARIGR
jgi:hypothetical protein